MPVNGTDIKYRIDRDSNLRRSVSNDTGPTNRQSQAASNEHESNDFITVTNLLESSDITSFNLTPLGLCCYLKNPHSKCCHGYNKTRPNKPLKDCKYV